jgi:methionyl-tRNA synthetase
LEYCKLSLSLSLANTLVFIEQHLWKVLQQNGHVYVGTYSGWYSVRDVEWVAKEQSYFFQLSAFEARLLEFYEQNPDFIAPLSRRNEVVSFVKSGLRDLSISRTSFKWGVPVPEDPDHVMYVWIDALANYITALGYPNTDEGSDFNKYWQQGTTVHVVGKDILRFHAVYWPAMLMAAGLPLPKRLFAHGWWTNDGQKISKSVGNVIDPVDLVARVRDFLVARVALSAA